MFKGDEKKEYSVHGHYEAEQVACQAVRTLLRYIGEDPDRSGIEDTPMRVVKALREMTSGLREDPKEILSRQFDLEHDELLILRGVPFTSLCEHHLLPFTGEATVAYIPKPDETGRNKVVGLSKLARLVLCFAKRPQIQERMTSQVTNALIENLNPLGAACLIKAKHSCMSCRGVRLDAEFITSSIKGVFFSDPLARAELMRLI